MSKSENYTGYVRTEEAPLLPPTSVGDRDHRLALAQRNLQLC